MNRATSSSTTVGLHPPTGVALRTVLDLSSQVLCVCDLEGRIVWCNLGFERALGYSRAEVLGRPLIELADEEGQQALDAARAAGQGDEVPGALARLRDAGGGWRTIDWTIRVDEERGLVFAAGRDVSEHQAADDAVRASEERLRAIVGHSPTAIYVKDLSGRYLLANEAWAQLAGRDAASMVGGNDLELQPANARRILELEEQLATKPSVSGDLRIDTPDGARDLLMSLFTLVEDDGTRFAICGIATDITERKWAEASLLERQRLLDTILEASPDIISQLDDRGRIRQVSSAEQLLLGYRHAHPEDAELLSLVHPDDFDHVASAFIAMATGSRSQLHVRYRVRHAEDRWVTMDSRAQAVLGDDGRFLGAVVVTRDVTARLESEQRLEALRQAAEQASKAKSDFLSRMSHELRTPLNAILGFSQLLQMDELAVEQNEAVEHILRGGRHLLDLIDEVLDIARIETGHLELALRPVLVADVVNEVVELNRPIAERAEVGVQSMIDLGDSPAVVADRQRLVQVMLNLVSNAVKYNRPGGRVDISCDATSENRVRIAVADTGRGIRPEDMWRVFEPFNRLGADQSGMEGTGVGLALAKDLVEMMHGTLKVESVPEVGSTFTVELPLAVVPDGARLGITRHGGVAGSTPTFRVLLVEENLESLELVERVLSRRPGVVVLAAMHGRMALDLAREHHPDLVLLDLVLPDVAGSVVLDELGKDPATANIPVAVLSTEAGGGQVRRLLGRGVAGQLAKPIDVRALLSLVDAARAATGK
jgi:PAS domain S-box-containing protein